MADVLDPVTILSSTVVAAVVSAGFNIYRERYILDRKADVDYRSNARRRLYEAVEPLRFQLLFAARDAADRVRGHVRAGRPGGSRWNMSVNEYYVQSFVYRILKPIAIGQLIQRQMSIADFAVDERAKELLRFDETARRLLSGSDVVLDHKADWSTQSDHLFADNLQVAASTLLVHEPTGIVRVADFAEFARQLKSDGIPLELADLFAIFGRCQSSLVENPIFWLRLVAYGDLSNRLVGTLGSELGFRDRTYDAIELLRSTSDDEISKDPAKYTSGFEAVINFGL